MIEPAILQVEDEEADIFLLQLVFKKAGITNAVHAVTDGQMAIDYLAGNGCYANREKFPLPCLVLLDLKLPGKSGLEVLEWIRQQPALKRLIVIAFSSSAFQEDIDKAYDLGATCYIQKPGGLDAAIEMARFLKGWWLDSNHFGTTGEVPGTATPSSTELRQPSPSRSTASPWQSLRGSIRALGHQGAAD